MKGRLLELSSVALASFWWNILVAPALSSPPFFKNPDYLVMALAFFPRLRISCVILSGLLAWLPARAQTTPVGTIEGRVFNPRTGEYLEHARVTVEKTGLETFTDSSGQYRLSQVPAGAVTLKVFFTGLDMQSAIVAVSAGATVQRDISLALGPSSGMAGKDGGVVKLDQFVVAISKEMEGAAMAINEQRFAPNVVNVVSTDEFGAVPEGNVGQFLKLLPGISVDYAGGDARSITMNGVPANNVPISIGGFELASAQSSGTARTIELELISINNISRIEVAYTPTPETPGSALAGAVNMVPRGAFERARPIMNFSTFVMMRDNERTLARTPGLFRAGSHKVNPGFDFSYIAPVNKRFGYTLSGNYSKQYAPNDIMNTVWRGSASVTNGTAYPDTTPDKPYLSSYAVGDGMKITTRSSVGATLDYKLTPVDRLTFSFQYAYLEAPFNNRTATFIMNNVAPGFTPFAVQTTVGGGALQLSSGSRKKSGTTYMPTFVWRHDGRVWKAEAGLGHSWASNHYVDIDKGIFNSSTARRNNVTIAFEDINYLRPAKISVTERGTGQAVDPYEISNYVLTSGNSSSTEAFDLKRNAYVNARRDFSVKGIPFSLRAGLDARHAMRDIRGVNTTFNFVGRDKIATGSPTDLPGSDDGARVAFDDATFPRGTPYGFKPFQWVSNEKFWELYQVHPEYFTTVASTNYTNALNLSKHVEEVISSAYLRGDLAFFDNRLKLAGGLRGEQTNVRGEGPLTDPTLNFQRDAAGNVRLAPGTRTPLVITTDALRLVELTRIDRGLHARKEYLRLFPSLNASYQVQDNLVARAGYYYSVGRPDFVEYSSGLTLPDTERLPAANNRITVNNVGLKAWSAQTAKVRIEYYFQRVGQVSVGAFRRDFRNFFGNTVFNATPAFLALYGLDAEIYGDYDVVTKSNLDSRVRMEGLEFDYKQALTFLPGWARGVQVFLNASALRATGVAADNFAGFIPRTGSWGVSLTRSRLITRVNWNYRGRQRRGLVAAGRSIEPATYNWGSKAMYVDVSAEWALTKRLALFGNLRNVGTAPQDYEIAGPSTPPHAQFRSRQDNASLWTFGIKGTF
ncbi:MAG: hypothetical protein RL077_4210 [Verrucomicrobiota bacterium]|jgi:TonB-dependent receptor